MVPITLDADGAGNITTRNWVDGELGSQADAANVLLGLAANESLLGLGGNDGIAGAEGDDWIEGGDGSDLLLGGTGADIINGGAANDCIFGSAMGSIDTPSSVAFTPLALPAGVVAHTHGFNWTSYRSTQPRLNGSIATLRYVDVVGASTSAYATPSTTSRAETTALEPRARSRRKTSWSTSPGFHVVPHRVQDGFFA